MHRLESTTQSRALPWIVTAFAGGIALSAAALFLRGTGRSGTVTGLLLTARWAYGFFWAAYIGGPLTTVFGRKFQPLARRGRELGLAFAAAMLMHVTLVAWLYHISIHPPLPLGSALFFAVGLGFVYVLAVCSMPALAMRIPPSARRVIFTTGTEYIAVAFLSDFLKNPFGHGFEHLVAYGPFVTLALLATLLRLISYAARFARRDRPPATSHTANAVKNFGPPPST